MACLQRFNLEFWSLTMDLTARSAFYFWNYIVQQQGRSHYIGVVNFLGWKCNDTELQCQSICGRNIFFARVNAKALGNRAQDEIPTVLVGSVKILSSQSVAGRSENLISSVVACWLSTVVLSFEA